MRLNQIIRFLLLVAIVSPLSLGMANETEDNEGEELEAIVVEGEKVRRTADEVTPNIHIIGNEESERAHNPDLYSAIQGVSNVKADSSAYVPTIRGINSHTTRGLLLSGGAAPRVPVLIDGVANPFLASPIQSNTNNWDISAIEVAKGPQPTSTGRNAFSGAVRVFTSNPVFEHEYAVRGGYRYQEAGGYSSAFMLNTPLNDQIAVRFTGEKEISDSYVDATAPVTFTDYDPNEYDMQRLRGKVRFVPEAIKGLDLQLSYTESDIERPSYYINALPFPDPDDLSSDGVAANIYNVVDQKTFSLNSSYEISDRLTWVARVSDIDMNLLWPQVPINGDMFFEYPETEVETYIQYSDFWRIKNGVLGIIRHDAKEKIKTHDPIPNLYTITVEGEVDGATDNLAVYAEMEFEIHNDLDFIAGVRYEKDERDRAVEVRYFRSGFQFTGVTSTASFKETVILPKIGFRLQAQDNLQVGYTYSESFRPGGLASDLEAGFFGIPIQSATYDPEFIRNHEFYAKSRWFGDKLQLNGSIFHYTYEDAQVLGASTVTAALIGNVPEAIGRGIEVEAAYDVGNGFGLHAGAGYLDTELSDVSGTLLTLQKGGNLPAAPKYTANFGVDYEAANYDLSAILRYSSGTRLGMNTGANDDYPEFGSHAVLDLAGRYFYEADNYDLELEAYIKNVFDRRYFTGRENSRQLGERATVGEPRAIGFLLTARF